MALAPLRILHLEDDPADAYLVRRTLMMSTLEPAITVAGSRDEFAAALAQGPWDVILSDNALPTIDSPDALKMARERCPATPFIVLSGGANERQILDTLQAGAADYILKDHLKQLVVAIHRVRLVRPQEAAATPVL